MFVHGLRQVRFRLKLLANTIAWLGSGVMSRLLLTISGSSWTVLGLFRDNFYTFWLHLGIVFGLGKHSSHESCDVFWFMTLRVIFSFRNWQLCTHTFIKNHWFLQWFLHIQSYRHAMWFVLISVYFGSCCGLQFYFKSDKEPLQKWGQCWDNVGTILLHFGTIWE